MVASRTSRCINRRLQSSVHVSSLPCLLGFFLLGGCSSDPGHPTANATPNSMRPSTPASGVGAFCKGDCQGTWCSAAGTTIDKTCAGSDLSMPCLGTDVGMYCSHTCTTGADCANAYRPLSCLVLCPNYPDAEGRCWATSSAQFMANGVCGAGSTIVHADHIALSSSNDGTGSTLPPSIAPPPSPAATPAPPAPPPADIHRPPLYRPQSF